MKMNRLYLYISAAKIAVLFTFFSALSCQVHAQLYYLTSDGAGATTSVTDAFYSLGSGGTPNTLLYSSITQGPALTELDKTNDRFFVFETFTGVRSIKVFRLSTGVLLTTIPVTPIIVSMEYDPVSNYLYYITSDQVATTGATDALVKVRPDGTGSVTLKASLSEIPLYLALDIPHNKIYYYNGLTATRGVRTFDLISNTEGANVATQQLSGLEYYAGEDYLYLLGTDGTTTQTAADCLMRMRPDGSSLTTLATSITATPASLALDIPALKAYFYNGITASRGIFSIGLGSVHTVTNILPTTSLAAGQVVASIATAKSLAVLPVTFISFTAAKQKNSTLLKWTTGDEVNVSSYRVQRSADGNTYKEIGTTAVAGGSQTNKTYSFTDLNPLPGLNFYRISSVDVDGKRQFSSIQQVRFDKASYSLTVLPNPVRNHSLRFRWSAPEGRYSVSLFDNTGRLVTEVAVMHSSTDMDHVIKLPAAVTGDFYLVMSDESGKLKSAPLTILP